MRSVTFSPPPPTHTGGKDCSGFGSHSASASCTYSPANVTRSSVHSCRTAEIVSSIAFSRSPPERNGHPYAAYSACIDVMSGGRLIFGIGAGWYHEECAAYGWPFLSGGERLKAMDETISAVRQLWTEERVTFAGEYVQLADALCDPKPLQSLPPVWVGGGGEKVTLRIAARQADATNWQVNLDEFVRKSKLLEQYCDEIARPFEEIVRTHGPDCR